MEWFPKRGLQPEPHNKKPPPDEEVAFYYE